MHRIINLEECEMSKGDVSAYDGYLRSVRNESLEEKERRIYRGSAITADEAVAKAKSDLEDRDHGFGVMPQTLRDTECAPSVDPTGCYSSIDLAFKARLRVVNHATDYCNRKIGSYVRGMCKTDWYKKAQESVERISKECRTLSRAEQYLADTDEQDAFRERIETMSDRKKRMAFIRKEDSELKKMPTSKMDASYYERRKFVDDLLNVELMDQAIEVMEYQTGLRKMNDPDAGIGDMPKNLTDTMRQVLFMPTDEVKAAAKNYKIPDEIKINFDDFSGKLMHAGAALPLEGYVNLTSDQLVPQVIDDLNNTDSELAGYADKMLEDYVVDTVCSQLNVFGQRSSRPGPLIWNNVIIGGEVAVDLFERESGVNPADYLDGNSSEYGRKMNEFCAKKLAAALKADIPVEIFPCDQNGFIEEPVRITAEGHKPKMKVELNAWQRFWSNFGFYKKEVEAVRVQEEAEHLMEEKMLEARGRIYVSNAGAVNAVSEEFKQNLRSARVAEQAKLFSKKDNNKKEEEKAGNKVEVGSSEWYKVIAERTKEDLQSFREANVQKSKDVGALKK